jgi:uncharacterized membrane protein YphA (DoxX/SURF4 family)
MGIRLDFLRKPQVLRMAQIAIGAVFITAALSKIGDLDAFATQLHNYRMMPVWGENLVAMTLPWIELLAGLALLLGVRPRSGAFIVFTMMLAFTVIVGVAWARGLDVSCGCFGKLSAAKVGAQKMIENLGFLVLAAVAVLRPRD